MNASVAAQATQSQGIVLELYVVRDSPRSAAAIANLEVLRARHFPNAQVEVIDVWENPRRILTHNIFVTPMLVRVSPSPPCRIVGDLRDESRVLQALGISSE